jgi:hypothetical protein
MGTAAGSHDPHLGVGRDETVTGSRDTYVKGEMSSIGGLISDISADLATLLHQEVALAKAEARESAAKAGKGAGLLGGAGAAAAYAVLFLSIGLWWWLGDLLDSLGWSAVIVALLWAVIAAVLGSMGRSRIKEVQGMSRTVDSAKRVPDALKGNENRA